MAYPRQRQEDPGWWERLTSGYDDDRRRDWPTEDRWWERDPYVGPRRDYGPDYSDPWGRTYLESLPYWMYGWPLPSAYPRGYYDTAPERDRDPRARDSPDRDYQGGDRRDFWDRASDQVSSWFGDDSAERRRWRDRHRGKGPKGYTRTDERILEDVNDRLMEDGGVDASEIEVSVKDGEVTLSGSVTDRFEKRRAEDCADMVSGVRHTQNNLQIEEPSRGQRA